MIYAIWILTIFGMSMVLTVSKISSPIRSYFEQRNKFFYSLFSCPPCMAFWASVLTSWWFSPTGYIILDGFFGTGIVTLLWCISWKFAYSDDKF